MRRRQPGGARWAALARHGLLGLAGLTLHLSPACAAAAGQTPGPATPAATGAAGSTTPADGAALIKRLQESARLRSYTGTYVVSSAGAMSSARIVHAWDGSNQIERIESLDGQKRRVFRHNDAVHILWPASRSASIEPSGSLRGFPATPAADASSLEMYELLPGADDRIAGHDAHTVTLRPRDNARFMQRWWLDRGSGLLLRADVVSERGDVLESAAFSELQLGARVQAQALLAEMNRLEGYRVSRNRVVPTDLEREGWVLRSLVAGFRPVHCVQRMANDGPSRQAASSAGQTPGLAAGSLADAGASAGGNTVLQVIYSDGLTHVSIFIEAYRPDIHVPEPVIAMGATHALVRRLGEWWITVVGDVPPATLRHFALALERRKP
ncbi:MAG: hypothetical protein RLZZ584_720 [Pseudomonadota bacterium]